MDGRKILKTPLSDECLENLSAGEMVYICGDVYSGRDAAHKRMCEMLKKGEKMPFEFKGQVIYYMGPCPSKPGQIIGSAGPTTSGRMDAYSPELIRHGLKAMIGKGFRDKSVVDAIKKYGGVYFAAIGGAAAIMSKRITAAEVIAFDDLGTEAIRKLTVDMLPVIVAVDCKGHDVYKGE